MKQNEVLKLGFKTDMGMWLSDQDVKPSIAILVMLLCRLLSAVLRLYVSEQRFIRQPAKLWDNFLFIRESPEFIHGECQSIRSIREADTILPDHDEKKTDDKREKSQA